VEHPPGSKSASPDWSDELKHEQSVRQIVARSTQNRKRPVRDLIVLRGFVRGMSAGEWAQDHESYSCDHYPLSSAFAARRAWSVDSLWLRERKRRYCRNFKRADCSGALWAPSSAVTDRRYSRIETLTKRLAFWNYRSESLGGFRSGVSAERRHLNSKGVRRSADTPPHRQHQRDEEHST